MPNESNEQKDKLLQLIKDAVQRDKDLRDKFGVGEKFRFIRDRLNALLSRTEESIKGLQKTEEKKRVVILEDEIPIYVYLYNAQGNTFSTWHKMLSPSVFYEYSVNRPLYLDKYHIETFIRNKPNKSQHGYLTVVIKKKDILPAPKDTEVAKDSLGHPLTKVREGSLHFDKLVTFTHAEQDYVVKDGEIVKKL